MNEKVVFSIFAIFSFLGSMVGAVDNISPFEEDIFPWEYDQDTSEDMPSEDFNFSRKRKYVSFEQNQPKN